MADAYKMAFYLISSFLVTDFSSGSWKNVQQNLYNTQETVLRMVCC